MPPSVGRWDLFVGWTDPEDTGEAGYTGFFQREELGPMGRRLFSEYPLYL